MPKSVNKTRRVPGSVEITMYTINAWLRYSISLLSVRHHSYVAFEFSQTQDAVLAPLTCKVVTSVVVSNWQCSQTSLYTLLLLSDLKQMGATVSYPRSRQRAGFTSRSRGDAFSVLLPSNVRDVPIVGVRRDVNVDTRATLTRRRRPDVRNVHS